MQACLNSASNLIARDACYASLMPDTSDLASIGAYFIAGCIVACIVATLGRKYLL